MLMTAGMVLVPTAVVALWVSGFSFTGYFSSTDGNQPEVQITSSNLGSLPVGITNGTATYTNSDGAVTMDISAAFNVVSSDPNCNIEPGVDYKIVFLDEDEDQELTAPFSRTMNSGANVLKYAIIVHEYACPVSNGNFIITGSLP